MGATASVAVLANTIYGAATGTPGGLIGEAFGAEAPSGAGGASRPSGKPLSASNIADIIGGKTSFRGNASDLGVDTDTYNYLAYKAYGSWTPNGDGTYTNTKTGTTSSSPDAGTFRSYSADEDTAFAARLGVKPPETATVAAQAAPVTPATELRPAAIPVLSTALGSDAVSLDNPPKVSAPATMPTLATTLKATKRASIAEQRRRQGRASTILTGDTSDLLGG